MADKKLYRVTISFRSLVEGENERDALLNAGHSIPGGVIDRDTVRDIRIQSNGEFKQPLEFKEPLQLTGGGSLGGGLQSETPVESEPPAAPAPEDIPY